MPQSPPLLPPPPPAAAAQRHRLRPASWIPPVPGIPRPAHPHRALGLLQFPINPRCDHDTPHIATQRNPSAAGGAPFSLCVIPQGWKGVGDRRLLREPSATSSPILDRDQGLNNAPSSSPFPARSWISGGWRDFALRWGHPLFPVLSQFIPDGSRTPHPGGVCVLG